MLSRPVLRGATFGMLKPIEKHVTGHCKATAFRINVVRAAASAPQSQSIASESSRTNKRTLSSVSAKEAVSLAPNQNGAIGTALTEAKRLTGIYSELSKARLSALVVLSTSAGFMLAGAPIAVDSLACVSVGTMMAAASANTFNQLYEVKTDSMMSRTRRRPLPSGRISQVHAAAYGVGMGAASTALLTVGCNPLTGALGLANIALYAGVYTPLKQHHILNTWVGAIVGGIPPLMGYAAATGTIMAPEAAILGAGLFLWQFPHFFSLAWMIKKDYAAGGHHMVPCFDKLGVRTGQILARYSWALASLPLMSSALGITSSMFALESLAFNGYLLHTAYKFKANPGQGTARSVFRCSLWYLPLFMFLMVFHKNGWSNPDENGNYLTLGTQEWSKVRSEQQTWGSPNVESLGHGIQCAIVQGKQAMRDLCVHEIFYSPETTSTTSSEPSMLSSGSSSGSATGPNPLCPVSTTKAIVDERMDATILSGIEQQARHEVRTQ